MPISQTSCKVGDAIRLNDAAPAWTRAKVFYVETVKPWGVICWAESRLASGRVGPAYYRASWDQIAPVPGHADS